MSHFAKVVDGIVTNVIVAEQEFIDTYDDGIPGEWIQTSYNTNGGKHYAPNSREPIEDGGVALRKNYAGIGYTYDKTRDAFYPPQPFPPWTLNEDTCQWEAPVPYPRTEEDDDPGHQSRSLEGAAAEGAQAAGSRALRTGLLRGPPFSKGRLDL